MRAPVDGSLLAPRPGLRVLEAEEVPSDNTPGVWYTVTLHADGTRTCNCLDYRVRRAPHGEECKHIIRIRHRTSWSKVRK